MNSLKQLFLTTSLLLGFATQANYYNNQVTLINHQIKEVEAQIKQLEVMQDAGVQGDNIENIKKQNKEDLTYLQKNLIFNLQETITQLKNELEKNKNLNKYNIKYYQKEIEKLNKLIYLNNKYLAIVSFLFGFSATQVFVDFIKTTACG